MRDLNSFKGFPTVLTRREVFEDLPGMVDDIAGKVFNVDGKPSQNLILYLVVSIAKRTSESELMNLITTVLEAF